MPSNPFQENFPASLAEPRAGGSPLPIAVDLHSHTMHSHGQASVTAMYEAARRAGLSVFGFSEHSPRPEGYAYPVDYQARLTAEFPRYVKEVRDMVLRGKREGMTVLFGLEMDYIPGREDYAKALCEEYPYDYVIGGLHFQGTWGFDASAADWDAMSRNERFAAYARYYQDLAAMCRTDLFHIAAHPDLIKLFSAGSFALWLETPEADSVIRQALSAMKEHGVCMEISSAGLRKPCKEIYPCPAVMRLAAELQLPITFGSDAHCTNTPAFAFHELARYAAGFGYAESAVFEHGQRRMLPFKTGE